MSSVLTLNGGSSSIRFAFFGQGGGCLKLLEGKIERIGMQGTRLVVDDLRAPRPRIEMAVAADDHRSAVEFLMRWLADDALFAAVAAVGHRVVYGMQHSSPERVTASLLAELKRMIPYDPEHLPREIELIESVARARPELPQVACFDTAFHRTMPRVATLVPIPRRFQEKGVQRYGFHGLSYSFLLAELERLGDTAAGHGRVILAHLGNGASLAAVRDGRCVDTSMGFTPNSGFAMSTRSGDLDPGVLSFLAATESMDVAAYQRMVTLESGLLGLSETSADIRDLLSREFEDARAADAVSLFCYQVKKWIGSFAAVLGGLDTLVFAGGIGENSAVVRARICAGLEFLGVELDSSANELNAPLVSMRASPAAVRVIRTDEESVIAEATRRTLDLDAR